MAHKREFIRYHSHTVATQLIAGCSADPEAERDLGEQLPENGLDMEEDDLEEALEEAALDDDDEELP